jgi:hypothetical protein
MVGHIDDDAGLTAALLPKQQHDFELERGLIVEQVLPPAARHNFWEDNYCGQLHGRGNGAKTTRQ